MGLGDVAADRLPTKLDAGFGQEGIKHQEEIAAVVGGLRVGHVLNGRSVVDHQKGPNQRRGVYEALITVALGGGSE